MGWPRSRPLSIHSYVTMGQGLQIYPRGVQHSWRVVCLLLRNAKWLQGGLGNHPMSAVGMGILHIPQHGMGVQGSSYCSFKPSHQQSSSQTFPYCPSFNYCINLWDIMN